jgi:hypothetical protein
MYCFEDMIDLGIEKNEKWKTKAHRQVAITLLICNPRVDNRTLLMDLCKSINSIDKRHIKKFTIAEAVEMGVPVN